MLDSMTFGDLLTVLSILGGIGLLLIKLGRKDAQFEKALEEIRTTGARVAQHDGDFDALRTIISDLGRLQAVTERDTSHHRDQLRDILKRIAAIENKRGVLDT